MYDKFVQFREFGESDVIHLYKQLMEKVGKI